MIHYISQHYMAVNFDFSDFTNKTKSTRNSVLFKPEDIKAIMIASNSLKLYNVINQDENLRVNTDYNTTLTKMFLSPMTKSKTIMDNLYNVVMSKTQRYMINNDYMWKYLTTVCCKTKESHVISILNTLVNTILPSCAWNENPIVFMQVITKSSLNWLLKAKYSPMTFTDQLVSEDIQLSIKDNLHVYSSNNLLNRLIIWANTLMERCGVDESIFRELMSTTADHSPIQKYISFPILQNIVGISKQNLGECSIEQDYLVNLLIFHCLTDEFKTRFPILTQMLRYMNTERINYKATYKFNDTIRDYLYSIENNRIFGMKSISYRANVYSNIIGRILKNEYRSLVTGNKIYKKDLNEKDFAIELMDFLTLYFEGNLNKLLPDMKKTIMDNI